MKEFFKKIGAGIVAGLKKAGAWAWGLVKKHKAVLIALVLGIIAGLWIVRSCR
jgi:hypothetical protein